MPGGMAGLCYMLSHKLTERSNPGDAVTLGWRLNFGPSRWVIPVTDDHSDGINAACCASCQNGARSRPRLVIGVFNDARSASGVAERLRTSSPGSVNVLSSALPILSQDLDGLPALSLMGCGRLYQQITRELESGASIVIVDAQSSEQQLGISRVLLESKCDLLLTHDGSSHAHTD